MQHFHLPLSRGFHQATLGPSGIVIGEMLDGTVQSQTLCLRGNFSSDREPGGPGSFRAVWLGSKNTSGGHVDRNTPRDSDRLVVPAKSANKSASPAESESIEGSGLTNRNVELSHPYWT